MLRTLSLRPPNDQFLALLYSSHDLRHHYASVLLAAGESVVAVAERLGHENADLVLSTYGHLQPNAEEGTRRGPRRRLVCTHCVPGRCGGPLSCEDAAALS